VDRTALEEVHDVGVGGGGRREAEHVRRSSAAAAGMTCGWSELNIEVAELHWVILRPGETLLLQQAPQILAILPSEP
jgi:hypothetical protein